MTPALYIVVLVSGDPLFGTRMRRAFLQSGRNACLFLAGRGNDTFPPVQSRSYPDPELFLIDLDLPWEEVRAALFWIRKAKGLSDLPIVMLAGEDSAEKITGAYWFGASACIAKPTAEHEIASVATAISDYAFLLQAKPRLSSVALG